MSGANSAARTSAAGNDHEREAVRDAWAGFCAGIDGVSHSLVEEWQTPSATIVEADVTYTRKNGSTITLPVVTVYRGGELIGDDRIFMDVAPLFEADG